MQGLARREASVSIHPQLSGITYHRQGNQGNVLASEEFFIYDPFHHSLRWEDSSLTFQM